VAVHVAGKQPDILYFDFVFAVWVIYQVFWKGFFPSFSGQIVSIGVLCVIAGLFSTLVNLRDMYRGVAASKVLAVGILVYAVARKARLGLFAPSIFGACASILLLRDYQSLRYESFEGLTGLKDEIEITMGHSNSVASILILLIPLAIAGACLNRGKRRWIFILCSMLMCSGLLATMSRGAILAILGAALLSLPFLRKAGLKIRHGVVGLLAMSLTLALVPADLLETNAALFLYRWENPDDARVEIMHASWEAFLENPVLGVGPGELGDAINHHLIVPTIAGGHQYNAHNLVIDSLAEMGLPTGLALLFIVALVLRKAWLAVAADASALNVAVWVALLAAVMHNMVEASFEGEQFQVVFWTVAAMAGNLNERSQ
jgi:O-antigen ligase